jgi:hypothetical protein
MTCDAGFPMRSLPGAWQGEPAAILRRKTADIPPSAAESREKGRDDLRRIEYSLARQFYRVQRADKVGSPDGIWRRYL